MGTTKLSVHISQEEYDYLVARDNLLEMLEAHGVDNWQGFDDAMKDYCNRKKETNTI